MQYSEENFSVLLPILERVDIIKKYLQLKKYFCKYYSTRSSLVTVDGKVSNNFEKFIKELESIYPIEIVWINKRLN